MSALRLAGSVLGPVTPVPRGQDRGRRRATPRRRVVAAGVLLALAVSGCAGAPPSPQPDPEPAAPQPVLDQERTDYVLASVGSVLEQATATLDPTGLESRLEASALTIRTSQLAVAAATSSTERITLLPVTTQLRAVPTTQTWPRTLVAVTTQPDDLLPPSLLVIEQDSPRANYRLRSWARLFPRVEVPALADPTTGSASLAPDDASLLVPPLDAVARYVDVLNVGDASAFAAQFGTDTFRELIAQQSALQNQALAPAAGSQTMTFSSVPDTVRAVATVGGGALVVGELTALESRTAEAGATISPATDTERALTAGLSITNAVSFGYTDVVAMYVPPAGSAEPIRVLGVEHVATSAAVP